jgi:hypothetical protein
VCLVVTTASSTWKDYRPFEFLESSLIPTLMRKNKGLLLICIPACSSQPKKSKDLNDRLYYLFDNGVYVIGKEPGDSSVLLTLYNLLESTLPSRKLWNDEQLEPILHSLSLFSPAIRVTVGI